MADTNGVEDELIVAGDTLFCLEVYVADMQTKFFHGGTLPAVILSILDFEPVVFELPPSTPRSTSGRDHHHNNNGDGENTEDRRHGPSPPPPPTTTTKTATPTTDKGCPSAFHFGRGKSCSFKADAASVRHQLCTTGSLSLMVASRLSQHQAVLHGSCAINLSSFGPDVGLSRTHPHAVSCWGYSTSRVKAKDARGRLVATVELTLSLTCLGAAAELSQTPTLQSLVVTTTVGTVCPTCKAQGEETDTFVERAGHAHSDESGMAQRDAGRAYHLDQTAAGVALTLQEASCPRNDHVRGDLRGQQESILGSVVAAGERGECSTDGGGTRGEVTAKALGSIAVLKPAPASHQESEFSSGGARKLSGRVTWVSEFDPRDGKLKDITPTTTAATASTDASATSAAVVRSPSNDTPAAAACRAPGGPQATLTHNNMAATPGAAAGAAGTLNIVARRVSATNCTGEDGSRSEESANSIGTDGALEGEASPATSGGPEGRGMLSKDAQGQGEEDVVVPMGDGASLKPALAALAAAVAPETNGEGNAGVEGSSEGRSGRDVVEGLQGIASNIRMAVVDRGEEFTRAPPATVETAVDRLAMEGKGIRVKTGANACGAEATERAFPGNNFLTSAWRPRMSRVGQRGGIGYDGCIADGVARTTESQYMPIEMFGPPSPTARKTEGLKTGGSRAIPRTTPGGSKGNTSKAIIDGKSRQRSKATASPTRRNKSTPKPRTTRMRPPHGVRTKRSPGRRAGTGTNATPEEGGSKRGNRNDKNSHDVDRNDGAVPTRRPWGAGPGARATCPSANSATRALPGRASLSRQEQRGVPERRGSYAMGSRGRDSCLPLDRSPPPPPPPSVSLPESAAIQRFLPTWTSLIAEAAWLRGSTREGGDDHPNCAEISSGDNRASGTDAASGVPPPAAPSLFCDRGSEVCHQERRRCQRLETQGAVEEDGASSAKEQAWDVVTSCVDGGRVDGQGAGGLGLARSRADPPPMPSLDPVVERLLMDWLRSRIDRAGEVIKFGDRNDRGHPRRATEERPPPCNGQQSRPSRVAQAQDDDADDVIEKSASAGSSLTADAFRRVFEEAFSRLLQEETASATAATFQGDPCGCHSRNCYSAEKGDNKPRVQGLGWIEAVHRVSSMLEGNLLGTTKDQILGLAIPHKGVEEGTPMGKQQQQQQKQQERASVATTPSDDDTSLQNQNLSARCSESLRPPAICIDIAHQPPSSRPQSPARRLLLPESRSPRSPSTPRRSPPTPTPPTPRRQEEQRGLRPRSPMTTHRHQTPAFSQTTMARGGGIPRPESPRGRRTVGVPSSPRAARWLGSRTSHDDDNGGSASGFGSGRSAVVAVDDVDDGGNWGNGGDGGGGDGVDSAGVNQPPDDGVIASRVVSGVGEAGVGVREEKQACPLDDDRGDDDDDDDDARGGPCAGGVRHEVKGDEQDEDDGMMTAVEEYESDFEAEEE